MDKYTWLRQFISPFIQGENADALLNSLADEAQRQDDLSIAVTDQLTICTAISDYLDKRLAEIGITRPPDLGMDDLAFRNMGIQINAQKQIVQVIHTVLETFFGTDTVRAFAVSSIAEPYILQDGDDIQFSLEDGIIRTAVVQASNFLNITQATAQEVADVITRFCQSQNLNAYAQVLDDIEAGKKYVKFFASCNGPFSLVKIMGGRIQSVLQFPTMRGTNLSSNHPMWQVTRTVGSTVRFRRYSGSQPLLSKVIQGDRVMIYGPRFNHPMWQVTRTVGSTVRFRWYSGSQPLLSKVIQGDRVMIYGPQFNHPIIGDLRGTFDVTDVRPPSASPSLDAGWFEIENDSISTLSSTPAGVSPATNNPPTYYSFIIGQAEYSDMEFFLPKKNTPYSTPRFALAFEPANSLLKIYIPATTQVVRRDLIGAAHLHMLYDQYNLDGSFGSATNDDNRIEVVNDYSIRYRQLGSDNIGFGGTLTYTGGPLGGVPILQAEREMGFTVVTCTQPHGIIGNIQWNPATNYSPGAQVYWQNLYWTSLVSSGPLSINGAQQPVTRSLYWQSTGPGRNLSDTIVAIAIAQIATDDASNPFPGPYAVDPIAPYALTNIILTTRETIQAGTAIKTLFVEGAVPNTTGYLLFGLNTDKQEGPLRYFSAQTVNAPTVVAASSISQNGLNITVVCEGPHGAIPGSHVMISGVITQPALNGTFVVLSIPSPTSYVAQAISAGVYSVVNEGQSTTLVSGTANTLVIDPSYAFKFTHDPGTDVTVISDKKAYTPSPDGSDYGPYITDTAAARVFCQDLIAQITAIGINLEILVVYPSDIGLGNQGDSEDPTTPPNSDALWVWGQTST